jgi:hypothetical protein
MELLELVAGWIICIIVGGIGLAVIWRIFDGSIDLTKLVSEPNGDASMSRLQFLIFTFVIAISLFLIIVSQPHPAFPTNIPPTVLSLLGISASSYLVSKGIQFSNEAGIVQRTPEITIFPSSPTVAYGGTVQFTPKLVSLPGSKVNWSITAGAANGVSISDTGLFKAPQAAPAPGVVHHATIKAEIEGKPDISDIAVVTIQ